MSFLLMLPFVLQGLWALIAACPFRSAEIHGGKNESLTGKYQNKVENPNKKFSVTFRVVYLLHYKVMSRNKKNISSLVKNGIYFPTFPLPLNSSFQGWMHPST